MKALTLWEPWASFIADGFKAYETRSWETRYRGPLAIHAASRYTPDQVRMLLQYRREYPVLEEAYPQYNTRGHFALGCIIAIVELLEIFPTVVIRDSDDISLMEYSLGDWGRGRFAWQLKLIEKLDTPVRVRGRQGLWEWAP